jgi:hypothetical protein
MQIANSEIGKSRRTTAAVSGHRPPGLEQILTTNSGAKARRASRLSSRSRPRTTGRARFVWPPLPRRTVQALRLTETPGPLEQIRRYRSFRSQIPYKRSARTGDPTSPAAELARKLKPFRPLVPGHRQRPTQLLHQIYLTRKSKRITAMATCPPHKFGRAKSPSRLATCPSMHPLPRRQRSLMAQLRVPRPTTTITARTGANSSSTSCR